MNIKLLLVQAIGNYYLCEESKKQRGLKNGSLQYSQDVTGTMKLSKHFPFFSPLCPCLLFLSCFGGSGWMSDKVTVLRSNLSPFLTFCSTSTMYSFLKRCTYKQIQIHTENVDSKRNMYWLKVQNTLICTSQQYCKRNGPPLCKYHNI